MYKILIPVILFFTLIISSCNNSQSDLIKFEALNEGFINANATIHAQTFAEYKLFEKKLSEPSTKQKALEYYPKVMLIKRLSDSVRNYIEGLKSYLIKDDNRSANVESLFETNDKGNELYLVLKNYIDSILSVDTRLIEIFDTLFVITTSSFDSPTSRQKDFTQTFFHNTSTEVALAILGKFENNIEITENKAVAFFNNNIADGGWNFNKFSAIIGQSTNYTRAGQVLEIMAGVGAFTIDCKPSITFDGITIPVTENGVAVYKFKAPAKPGKHHIPVTIDYTDQLGKATANNYNIEYIVVEASK